MKSIANIIILGALLPNQIAAHIASYTTRVLRDHKSTCDCHRFDEIIEVVRKESELLKKRYHAKMNEVQIMKANYNAAKNRQTGMTTRYDDLSFKNRQDSKLIVHKDKRIGTLVRQVDEQKTNFERQTLDKTAKFCFLAYKQWVRRDKSSMQKIVDELPDHTRNEWCSEKIRDHAGTVDGTSFTCELVGPEYKCYINPIPDLQLNEFRTTCSDVHNPSGQKYFNGRKLNLAWMDLTVVNCQ